MPSVREHLIYKALVALNEVSDACSRGVVRPTFALRFCLAYLYSQSNGRREPYDDFWRCVQAPYPHSRDAGSYLRPTDARANLNGIVAGLGFNPTVEALQCLAADHRGNAAGSFWNDVQRQIDQGYPMPTPRFRREPPRRPRHLKDG